MLAPAPSHRRPSDRAPWPTVDRRWTAPVAVCLAGMIAVLVVGWLVRDSAAGLPAIRALNALHSPPADAVAVLVAVAVGPVCAMALGVVFAGIVAWRRRSLLTGLGAGAAVALAWLSSAAVKMLVARPRPDLATVGHPVGPAEIDASYPSGHVVFVAALVTVAVLLAGRRWRVPVAAGGGLGVILVAVARVYAGAHYPGDVVAAAVYGACAAVVSVAVVGLVLTRFRHAAPPGGGA